MNQLQDYMKTRRSALSVSLEEPGPDDDELRAILEIATRVPDHGKLAPWRIELWTPQMRKDMHRRLLDLLHSRQDVPDLGKKEQGTNKLLHAPTVLVVISTAADHPKIPVWEQQLSAGAVCMNTLIAANAAGYGSQWLTAWYVYDDEAQQMLGLNEGERIAGLIFIGSSSATKNERDRPDIDALYTVR